LLLELALATAEALRQSNLGIGLLAVVHDRYRVQKRHVPRREHALEQVDELRAHVIQALRTVRWNRHVRREVARLRVTQKHEHVRVAHAATTEFLALSHHIEFADDGRPMPPRVLSKLAERTHPSADLLDDVGRELSAERL